jgi:type II secretory pathway component PulF
VLVVTQDGIWALLGVFGGLALMWLVLRVVAPSLAVRVWYVVPVVGPMSRWARMARFCRLMELLLEQQVPAPEALRLCANGVREADLARGCRRAAVEVESGRGLAESLAQLRQFPPTFEPFLNWGEKTANMPVAFQAAAEAFEGRVRGDMSLLEAVLLPFTLLIILSGTFFLVIGLFLPLIGIIQNLT